MQHQAQQFLDLLEAQQLLSPDVLEELRRQVAESKARLTTELLAKLLVDNGHLTKFQATKLIAEVKQAKPSGSPAAQAADEDELGFAEDTATGPSGPRGPGGQPVAAVLIDDDDLDATQIDENDVVQVVDTEAVEVVPTVAAVAVESEERAVDNLPPVKRVLPAKSNSANPYDSFRILGVGLLLALVLIAGFFLVTYFWRGSAEDRLKQADLAYQQQSYETAAAMYREFAELFPGNENASYAKVRSALAAIRKDAEGAPDPQRGLDTAQNVLPGVASESALPEQQSDLAGALIGLAGKFTARADRTSETADRKTLMQQMDQLLELINNPQYVGTQQRNQQAPTLNRIQEDRQRILREINRDEDLAAALAEMDSKLAAKDTLAAYDVRKQLIHEYPLLEAAPGLAERVQQASQIQQSLVQPGNLPLKLSETPPNEVIGRSFVLAHRQGKTASALENQVVFIKAGGSVYGMDAASGNLLWRQYVGREFNSHPLRLGETTAADALICQAEQGRLARLDGRSGQAAWWASLETPIHNPMLDNADLFLATWAGTVACLDSSGGQLKWASQLPQPAATTPGGAFGQPMLYVPADHSNLYVVARNDGSCQEVYYLGHRSGAIAVPPILLLGQLFVFENVSAQTCKIRILGTSAGGLELREAQPSITMQGNIVVSPQVDGRHVIVQTDLGQIKVLDVEPTVQTQKVSELVTVPPNVFSPKQSWLVADANRVWVVDNQLTRFDIQLASMNMTRAWIKNDGDRFVAPPQRFGNVLIHSRIVRGTQGVRVAAVDSDSGDSLWECDVGIPVTHIATGESGYQAINSRGMLFALGNQPIRNAAESNPLAGKPSAMFGKPTLLEDGRVVMLNRARGNQLAVYTPGKSSLDVLLANLGTAQPASDLVAVQDKVVLGLDSGQLVLLNVTTGAITGAPYQPSMQADQKVRWNTPAYLPDSQTIIVASDLGKLVRLSVGSDLRSLSEVDLEHPLVGPIVAVGTQVCAVAATSGGDALQFFDATSLKPTARIALSGRPAAGPFAVPASAGGGCLLQTDSHLVRINPEGQQLWSVDFESTALVGPPIAVAENLIVATQAGHVWSLEASSGQVQGKLDAGQALSSTPVQASTNLLFGSDEGVVLALPIPDSTREPAP